MAVKVEYLSGRKGSNPGGKVILSGDVPGGTNGKHVRSVFEAYMKYCLLPDKLRGSSFTAVHQPIYEAATFQLARQFGLQVPNFFVLLNPRKDVVFEGWKDFKEKDPSGRRFYFISEWLTSPLDDLDRHAEHSRGSQMVIGEMPYLDILHIADITGKRQNYLLCDRNGEPDVYYVDLGCSFVRATHGRLVKPTRTRGIESPHALRTAERQIAKYGVITADQQNIIPLEALPLAIRNMSLPTLNPRGKVDLRDLVAEAELEEMERDIVYTASRNLHKLAAIDALITI